MKTIVIDFLYLDLSTCERCMGTDQILEDVRNQLNTTLKEKGIHLALKKTKIDSTEKAFQYHFLSSPTIRVDGIDILGDIKENICESCGDICGCTTLCRVFTYQGKDYNEPPREMLKEGILRVVGGLGKKTKESKYQMPGNIQNFLHKKNEKA